MSTAEKVEVRDEETQTKMAVPWFSLGPNVSDDTPVSVVVNSECRNLKPRDKWMKEDISLIESVIFDTVTSLENVYEDRVVRCRHCRRHSKDVQFYTYVSTTTLWYPSYITTI